ncbi:hypothetical protein [Ferrovibrio sp.]|uniref:hypothetical protein n=1 Tax=Ferrovibrio sp. TaxID=1917215 RepID=UPI00351969E5
MYNFLRRILLVGLGIGVTLVAMSWPLELVMRQRDVHFRLYQAFSSPAVKPQVLVLGDSRAALDVVGSMFSPAVFNWAEVGEGLRQTLLKADYALRTKPSLQWIVLPIDDYILSEYRSANRGFRKQMGYADWGLLDHYFATTRRHILRNYIAYYLPVLDHESRLSFRSDLLQDVEDRLGTPVDESYTVLTDCLDLKFRHEFDWAGSSSEARKDRVAFRLKAQYPEDLIVPQMVEILERIVRTANASGVQVVGVRYPMSNEYIEAAAVRDVSGVRAVFERIPFAARLDYTAMFAGDQAEFNDMDHLRHGGARAFTNVLQKDLAAITGLPMQGESCPSRTKTGLLVPQIAFFLGEKVRLPL